MACLNCWHPLPTTCTSYIDERARTYKWQKRNVPWVSRAHYIQGQLKLNYCTSSLHIGNRCLPTNSYNYNRVLKMPCYLTSQMCFSQCSAFHFHDDTLVQNIWKKKGRRMKKKLVAKSTKRRHNSITTCFSCLFWFLRFERKRWLDLEPRCLVSLVFHLINKDNCHESTL